jgi:hypothetical protein
MNNIPKVNLLSHQLPALSLMLCALAALSYQLEYAYGLLACLMLSSLLICAFTDKLVSALGFFLLANNFILSISFIFHDGVISYLWTATFDAYYRKVLLLETLFWCFFVTFCGAKSAGGVTDSIVYRKNMLIDFPPIIFLLAGIPMLIGDIVVSSSSYFISYVEFSSTGTVAYETGAAFIAFGIFLRVGKRTPWLALALEALAILLILYIAVGSGKRLPLAYPVFSYTVLLAHHFSRLAAGTVYFAIALSGYVFGIVRDAMTLQSISSDILLSGLRSTNQGATVHASAVYVRIADEGLITTGERFVSFVSNMFLAAVVPVGSLPDVARVNEFAMTYYDVQGNGGLIGPYSYFFLGLTGPVLLAAALAWVYRSKGAIPTLAFGFLAVMNPRWTLYNIGPALRILGFTALFVLIVRLVRLRTAPQASVNSVDSG